MLKIEIKFINILLITNVLQVFFVSGNPPVEQYTGIADRSRKVGRLNTKRI